MRLFSLVINQSTKCRRHPPLNPVDNQNLNSYSAII